MAASQIAATAELFERILYYLPMIDLLRVQSLSKATKTLVDDSPLLQTALYFKAAPIHANNIELVHPLQNRMCLPYRGRNYNNFRIVRSAYGAQGTLAETAIECVDGKYELGILVRPKNAWRGYDKPNIKSEGSWRRMLVTNPPCDLRICYVGHHGRLFEIGRKTEEDCTTMGELINLIIVEYIKRAARLAARFAGGYEEEKSRFIEDLLLMFAPGSTVGE